jgi:flagellar biosynthesis/type III secretory pathway M-ring protein FliF/YscJ
MGGVILIFLLVVVILILITPALRARGAKARDDVAQTAHEAVISRLEDHRKRRQHPNDDVADS